MNLLQHDLVNVLYTIKGLIEGHISRAGEGCFAADRQNAEGNLSPTDAVLRRIYPQVVRAVAITRRLRHALKAQSGSKSRISEVSIRKAWTIAVKILKRRGLFKNIERIEHISGEFPNILCDRRDLIEILYCLADNAVQAMAESCQLTAGKPASTNAPAGKLIIRTSLGFGRDGEPSAQITLADTGPGMPEETLNYLFEPFFTTKPPAEGLPAGGSVAGNGLGLCLVKALVRKNGGTISVSSFPGCGTTFTLTFPIPKAKVSENPKTCEIAA